MNEARSDIRNAAALRRTTGATTEDVIKNVFLVHEHLQAEYSVMAKQASRERMKLLFDSCMAQEARMLSALYDVLHTVSETTLKRNFKYCPVVPLGEISSHLHLHPEMTPQEVVEESQRLQEALSTVYAPITESAVPPDLTEVLSSLRELEKQHAVAIRRAALDE
jgi:rubrerythrin